MTSILDIRTVLITYAASSAICLAVIAPVWRDNRERIPGLGFWLADYMLQFVAMPLIALRGIVPTSSRSCWPTRSSSAERSFCTSGCRSSWTARAPGSTTT